MGYSFDGRCSIIFSIPLLQYAGVDLKVDDIMAYLDI